MTQLTINALAENSKLGVYEIKRVFRVDRFSIFYHALNRDFDTLETIREYFPRDLAVRAKDGHMVKPASENAIQPYKAGLKAFLAQGETLSQIEHQGIARVRNTPKHNETAYMITEHIDATPLSRLYDSSVPFAGSELKSMLLCLLDSLKTVHEYGSVHGRIHPENILIKTDGNPVLINFSEFELTMPLCNDSHTQETNYVFSSAERYEEGTVPRPSTDLYSLGATMYRCIMHTAPLPARNRLCALLQGKPDPLKPASETAQHKDDENLLKTVDWLLCPRTEDRPHSASEAMGMLYNTGEDTPKIRYQTINTASGQLAGIKEILTGFSSPWARALTAIGTLAVATYLLFPLKDFSTNTSFDTERKIRLISLYEDDKEDVNGKPFEHDETAEFAATESLIQASIGDEGFEPSDTSLESDLELTEHKGKIPAVTPQLLETGKRLGPGRSTEQTNIRERLDAGKKSLAGLRLTKPIGDSAVDHFTAALALEPGNTEARNGLQKIVDTYVWLIERDLEKGQVFQAQLYFDRALSISPDAPILARTRAHLAKAWIKKSRN